MSCLRACLCDMAHGFYLCTCESGMTIDEAWPGSGTSMHGTAGKRRYKSCAALGWQLHACIEEQCPREIVVAETRKILSSQTGLVPTNVNWPRRKDFATYLTPWPAPCDVLCRNLTICDATRGKLAIPSSISCARIRGILIASFCSQFDKSISKHLLVPCGYGCARVFGMELNYCELRVPLLSSCLCALFPAFLESLMIFC